MYSLDTKLSDIKGIGARLLARFERLGVKTVHDILRHFPVRYEDYSEIRAIRDVRYNELATIHGVVKSIDVRGSWKNRRMSVIEAIIMDETGSIKATWFNQPYIAKMLTPGTQANFSGKPTIYRHELVLQSPVYEITHREGDDDVRTTKHTAGLVPIYPETKGLTSRGIRYLVHSILKDLNDIPEWIPEDILAVHGFPHILPAFRAIHFPETRAQALKVKKRFAFEGIFLIQLLNMQLRQELGERRGYVIETHDDELEHMISQLPFTLTASQRRSVMEIFDDFKKGIPMNRLLQGDVGSGKTVIAALASLIVSRSGCQSVFLAPTEILALQHYKTLKTIFQNERVAIGLVTRHYSYYWSEGLEEKLSKKDISERIRLGKIQIVIGTHAVIQKAIRFAKLALIVVDEQHRFGVRQRAELMGRSQFTPHFLSMSATPIPRTLALTIFGDLDLSIIDEQPKGRKPIITKIVDPHNREKAYAFIRGEVKKGRQVFVICPRIEKSEQTDEWKLKTAWDDVRAVTEEYEKLSKTVFPDLRVAMMHGKLTSEEKKKVMDDFSNGKSDILISTSVVEVGVDIPNATIMMIDGADRFGLAQLYQFRGRVGRGEHQSYCLLFSESNTKTSRDRLEALITAKNGFDLAERDLKLRGPGEFLGEHQSGLPDIAMEALTDMSLVRAARESAQEIIGRDPALRDYPLLKVRLAEFEKDIHFE